MIAGEYKNAGWLWGARIINGQAGGFRLIPANYIEYLPEHPPVLSQTRSIHTAVSSLGAQSMSAQAASHFSQGEPAAAEPAPAEPTAAAGPTAAASAARGSGVRAVQLHRKRVVRGKHQLVRRLERRLQADERAEPGGMPDVGRKLVRNLLQRRHAALHGFG